jgi:hypothetical protein
VSGGTSPAGRALLGSSRLRARTSSAVTCMHFSPTEFVERFLDGLRKAGLPE